MDSLLTTDDIAAFFRVDVVTVRRMISKGELTAYRVGGEYRFKQSDIDAYLERQRLPCWHESYGHLGKLTERARKFVGSEPACTSDRFSEPERRVLTIAQEEAHRFHQHAIGTEHILLGLVQEGDGVVAKVLSNFGVELSQLRATVESLIGQGECGAQGEIGIAPRAKKVLAHAVDEARSLGHQDIGTAHLLLGLLHEEEGVAAKVLSDLKIELGKARACVQEILAGQGER